MTDHLQYCRDVLAGEVIACEAIRQACQRSLDDHARFRDDGAWIYRQDFAAPVLKFVELCPHVKGAWARRRETIKLEPWQRWIIAEIFGWRRRDDPTLRRFTEAIVEVGKKNGKTFFAAALALYELRFGDSGAEVVSAATKQDQARIVWEAAGEMLARMPREIMGGAKKTISLIRFGSASFKPLSKQSKTLDGLNPSFFIVDEAAAIDDRSVIEAIVSGMGARENAWTLYVTTAQVNLSTHYYEKRDHAKAVLRGDVEADRTFAAIFEIDENDDIDKDTACWVKANPNLGVSVQEAFLAKQVRDSASIPSQRNGVLIKHFNRWVGSASAWLSAEPWRAAAVEEIPRDGVCWIGTDLAQTRDLCAVARVWGVSRGRYAVDFRTWLPEAALDRVPVKLRVLYDGAVERGILEVTGGSVTDYDGIAEYLRASCRDHDVRQIGIDPWNATSLTNALESEGFPILTVRQSIAMLSGPSKIVESLIEDRKISHDGDPFITWQLEGCHAYRDVNHNVKIRQGPDPTRKIDAIIALIIAAACIDFSSEPESEPAFHFQPFHRDASQPLPAVSSYR